MKKDIQQAKVESTQDVHETTAKAAKKAKAYAAFKLQQTRLKGKSHEELSQKAKKAQLVLRVLISSKNSTNTETWNWISIELTYVLQM